MALVTLVDHQPVVVIDIGGEPARFTVFGGVGLDQRLPGQSLADVARQPRQMRVHPVAGVAHPTVHDREHHAVKREDHRTGERQLQTDPGQQHEGQAELRGVHARPR